MHFEMCYFFTGSLLKPGARTEAANRKNSIPVNSFASEVTGKRRKSCNPQD